MLESIVARPERRKFARRWALDASASFRRHAAARWLLSHPAVGEREYVRWLLTDRPVKHSLHYVKSALAHPDEAVRAAALALLPRVLEGLGADADLASVARSFFDSGRADSDTSFSIMMGLEWYVSEVNASGHACSSDSIRTLIELTKRYLATASDEQVRSVANVVCSSLATAARILRLASLAAWVRDPLGAYADVSTAPSRIEDVRAGIISGILPFGEDGTDLDSEVLRAVAATENPTMTFRAHSLLLEREALTEAQLLAEWGAVSDAVIVDQETAPARFCAVQDQLRRQAPRARYWQQERYAARRCTPAHDRADARRRDRHRRRDASRREPLLGRVARISRAAPRMAARGNGDLVPTAHAIHRPALGADRRFIGRDPRRRQNRTTVRSPETYETGMPALRPPPVVLCTYEVCGFRGTSAASPPRFAGSRALAYAYTGARRLLPDSEF